MTRFSDLLTYEPVLHLRCNHALEHATLQILSLSHPTLRLAGYSDIWGFWVVGKVSSDALAAAVEEGQLRLRSGEAGLAIHAYCGTNFLASGILAGSAAWLGMLGVGRGISKKLDRLPLVIMLVTLALILGRNIGPTLQARVTTSSQVEKLEVVRLVKSMRKGMPVHRIVTKMNG
jgi:hypothetical protein